MGPTVLRAVRRIITFILILWLGNMLWKNHTTPHYETPGSNGASTQTQQVAPETPPPGVKSSETNKAGSTPK